MGAQERANVLGLEHPIRKMCGASKPRSIGLAGRCPGIFRAPDGLAMNPQLRPGLSYRLQYRVPAEKTVPHIYPEFAEFRQMPEVFATGFLVSLIEGACLLAIKPFLDWPREQTVGTHVCFSHLAPTPPGQLVTIDCEVTHVEGRRIRFRARAHDEQELISEGTHERAVIDVARFNERLRAKQES